MIRIDSVADISRAFSRKIIKDGDAEVVKCVLKFSDCPLDRDIGDELLGMPIGWLTSTHYNEMGEPLRPFNMSEKRQEFQVNGTIEGRPTEGNLSIIGGTLKDVDIRLDLNKILVGGVFLWDPRDGEEAVNCLLGKTCVVKLTVTCQRQGELPFEAQSAQFVEKVKAFLKVGGDPGADEP